MGFVNEFIDIFTRLACSRWTLPHMQQRAAGGRHDRHLEVESVTSSKILLRQLMRSL